MMIFIKLAIINMKNISQPRVLHSAALLRPPPGIMNQMKWEQEAALTLKIPWKTLMYCPSNSLPPNNIIHFDETIITHKNNTLLKKINNWISLRRNYHEWLKSQIDNYDIFLLRYYVHDTYQFGFLKTFPKPVFLIHHTLEVPELAMQNTIESFIRSNLEHWIGKRTLDYTRGIIAVTDEILEYEKSRSRKSFEYNLVYPNGVSYSLENHIIDDNRMKETPELLFVASGFAAWHGLDLLIHEVKKTNENFILHIVGDINPEINTLINKDKRIIKHGLMKQVDILELSTKCWLGLSSFALHRKNMKQACTLKVREYLMMGLPVYAGHQDVFPCSFPYFHHGKCNIDDILKHARLMRNHTKHQVSILSKPYIDKNILLENLYHNLKFVFQEHNKISNIHLANNE